MQEENEEKEKKLVFKRCGGGGYFSRARRLASSPAYCRRTLKEGHVDDVNGTLNEDCLKRFGILRI